MQFKQLLVWKRSSRLCVEIYKYCFKINNSGFSNQLTRSALSIPSNIAEGEDRDSVKDGIRFFNIAKGSSAETITQVYIGIEIGFIDKHTGTKWIFELEQINKMIGGLIKSKKQKLIK